MQYDPLYTKPVISVLTVVDVQLAPGETNRVRAGIRLLCDEALARYHGNVKKAVERLGCTIEEFQEYRSYRCSELRAEMHRTRFRKVGGAT